MSNAGHGYSDFSFVVLEHGIVTTKFPSIFYMGKTGTKKTEDIKGFRYRLKVRFCKPFDAFLCVIGRQTPLK